MTTWLFDAHAGLSLACPRELLTWLAIGELRTKKQSKPIKFPLNVLPEVRHLFYLLRPAISHPLRDWQDFRILYVPHAGLRQHKLFAKNIENQPIFDKKR